MVVIATTGDVVIVTVRMRANAARREVGFGSGIVATEFSVLHQARKDLRRVRMVSITG